MWRRKIFFWLDNLNITPTERNVIIIVTGILLLVSLVNIFLRKKQLYHQINYIHLEKIYQEKLVEAHRVDSLRRIKYYTANPLSRNKDHKKAFKKSTAKPSGKDSAKLFPNNKAQKKLISINKAGRRELMSLTGIGPKTSQKIIKYREKNGPFKTLRSIKNVKGIGEKKFEKIKSHITL